jgi:hypothetical protein
MLRHTLATPPVNWAKGVDIATVALRLGHEIAQTTHIYEHADSVLKPKERDRIGTRPHAGETGGYRPADTLLAFLSGYPLREREGAIPPATYHVVPSRSHDYAEQAQRPSAELMRELGLTLNPDRTRVIDLGLDGAALTSSVPPPRPQVRQALAAGRKVRPTQHRWPSVRSMKGTPGGCSQKNRHRRGKTELPPRCGCCEATWSPIGRSQSPT